MHDFNPSMPAMDHQAEHSIHFRIGKVASLYGITVQTLRHYDKIGLFQPELINQETGYRYYSLLQLRQLEYILFLRRLKFSLPQIKVIIDEFRAGGDFYEILARRDRELEADIRSIEALRGTIQSLLSIHASQTGALNCISIREFAPPRLLLRREIAPLDVADPDFPLILMEHRKLLLGTLSSVQTSYSFGATVSLQDYMQTGTLRYTSVLLDPGPYGNAGKAVGNLELPQGTYATIRFQRTDTRPESAYDRLCQFVTDHQFETSGMILEMALDPTFSSISRISDTAELQLLLTLEP